MELKDNRKQREAQLDLPGVFSPDEIIQSWMAALKDTPEYVAHRGEFALFEEKTGKHLGYRTIVERDSGDERFPRRRRASDVDSEETSEVPPGTRLVFIQ